GPRAAAAWCAEIVAGRPRAVRRRGVVVEVAWGGRSGRILAEGGGHVFVRRTQLCPGLALAPGARVSFVQKGNGPRPTAYDVRPPCPLRFIPPNDYPRQEEEHDMPLLSSLAQWFGLTTVLPTLTVRPVADVPPPALSPAPPRALRVNRPFAPATIAAR